MKPRSEWKQPKRSAPPRRTSWLARGTKPIPRGTKPKAVNRKRKASEFARTYHSRARVAFVKSLGCVYCTALHPLFGIVSAGKSDNAHTEGGGMGRKGPYTSIVPLDRTHHRMYDERRGPFADEAVRAAIASAALEVERMWLAHQEAIGG